MRTSVRSRLSLFAALGVGAALFLPTGGARAVAPSYFPTGFGQTSTAYTLRFAGADRYATAGTGALVAAFNQKTTTGWPYNEGNPFSPAKAYGAASCPSTVLIVASDGLPDALAGSSMRGIGSLALPGSAHVYNTANALLLLTDTARPPTNGTTLNAETKTALSFLKSACSGFDAIILGGVAAVPSGVEAELGAYASTVGRIAGLDRFDTAGQIAADITSSAGFGHVNYFSSATSGAAVESRAVFLAEGGTGADALAVGPVAADTNVPILLTSSGGLPSFTSSALATLRPTNIIVLGGPAAVSDAVVGAAKSAAGAANVPIRIFGSNRSATSVALAETLDNLWPANATNMVGQDANAFVNQGFALARSEGSGSSHVGWPDALSSALVLASLHKAGTVPLRLAPPIEANAGSVTLGGTSGPSRFPLLLTGGGALAPEVDAYLKGLYPMATRTASTASTADQGGFGYVFGGQSALAPAVELSAAQDLSGQTYTLGAPRSDLLPSIDPAHVFYTRADFSAGYQNTKVGDGGINGFTSAGDKLCVARAGGSGVSLLDLFGSTGFIGLPTPLPYETSGPFPAGKSVPLCVSAASAPTQSAGFIGVSLSGSLSAVVSRDWSSTANVLRTTTAGTHLAPADVVAESPMSPIGNIDNPALPIMPTTLSLTYHHVSLGVTYKGNAFSSGTLTVNLVRTSAASVGVDDSITCNATFAEDGLVSGSTAFTADITADSATVPTLGGNVIACAGEYVIGSATGGVRFTITGDNTTAALTDLYLDGNA